MKNIPRILFAAPCSGAGKTTVTCAVLRAWCRRGLKLSAFKCGPDYIDPMFHREVLGVPSANLDLFLLNESMVQWIFQENAQSSDLAFIEGAMGYYDGVGLTERAGSYELARATRSPAILIVDGRGAALSLLAQIKGFLSYRTDSRIAGVLFNHLSPSQYPALRECVERELGVKVLGFLPKMEDIVLKSRHLGLITAEEVEALQKKLDLLAEQAERTIDLDGILSIAKQAEPFPECNVHFPAEIPGCPRIAVAWDRAFCFYYTDSLKLLKQLGAQLIFFSPMTDRTLPPGCSGLILGGGYPELHAAELEANGPMLQCIRTAIQNGMPCVAECGGFLYLHRTLEDTEGKIHQMTGVLPAYGKRTGRLQHFGYATLTANKENLLCQAEGQIPVHEFHYWESTNDGGGFLAKKASTGTSWPCIHASRTLFAGFPHLHFCSNPQLAINYLRECTRYKEAQMK